MGDWEKLEENVGNQDISNIDEISELVESDVENSLLMEGKFIMEHRCSICNKYSKNSTEMKT